MLRIDPENGPLVRTRLLDAVDQFGQGLFGRYVVIDEVRFRSRSLLPQPADVNIDVDIDVLDTSLSGSMRPALVPAAIAPASVADTR
ncbi:hypothetical protein ACTGJ9_024380 [Bradyrhizobium sp. RDM12]